MSKKFKELNATSIAGAFSKTLKFLEYWAYQPTYCWFRGIKNGARRLQPGACWRSDYDEPNTLVDFVSRGVAFGDVGGIDEWSTYYLAQHHGIPTRLIDWTESFTAALFFAFDGWDGKTTPAIWILQPQLLNETFLGWYGILGPERNDEMSIYLARSIAQPHPQRRPDKNGYVYDNEWPLSIYPRWTNTRIAAQQGMFTIHGRDPRPLPELISAKGENAGDHIARLNLIGFRKASIYSELAMLGIRRSAFFPDMDNFVKELKHLQEW